MSIGATLSSAAMAFPFTAPRWITLGADYPLPGQRVLCMPDSVFARGEGTQQRHVKRFAITPPVTNKQFAAFARRSKEKIFLMNISGLRVMEINPKPLVKGKESFENAAQRVVGKFFTWARSVTREELGRDVGKLLGRPDSNFSQLAEILLQSGFYLFQTSLFSYPAGEGGNPVRVPFQYAVAYADSVQGRLPFPRETEYVQEVTQDDNSKEPPQWTVMSGENEIGKNLTGFSVVLERDPLELLEVFPFSWQIDALQPEIMRWILQGLAGVLERETGKIHVFPDESSALATFPNLADFKEEEKYDWISGPLRRPRC